MVPAPGDREQLKFAQRALNEIERGKRRWLARRDKNPELFEFELAEAFEIIKAVPALGSPTDIVSRGKLVRRVEMRCTIAKRTLSSSTSSPCGAGNEAASQS